MVMVMVMGGELSSVDDGGANACMHCEG